MQSKKVPSIAGHTKQFQQLQKFDESELIPIATQVSFDALLNVIKALPIEQKWQIYQVLGVELYPQPPQAKVIEEKADEESKAKLLTVVEEDTQTDEEALNTWLTARGYQKAE
ncbi:hypothetical protein PseudUWO311_04355 [Pseudanabaena sp. UWO311]|uniref:hypothetical protein n=1 Tax=Pseudanabaena sp. UWO311 TaxID=2487337 RepID=UPI001157EC1A|nr:hypothetical protein [Pseudanabaena sp. UWO311]TYQ28727.1 hypothetical protein PseudUWO311_04355 [Pseudanabaena sp. UWO311]